MSCPEYHSGLKLCERGYCSARARYEKYPSAYANLHAAAVCKGEIADINGETYADEVYMGKLTPESKESNNLRRWLEEEWVNVCRPKKEGGYEACGSQTPSKYPYCRPLKRVSSKTPKTVDEMTQEERSALCQAKQNINPKEGKDPKRVYVSSNGRGFSRAEARKEIEALLASPPASWKKLFSEKGFGNKPSIEEFIKVCLGETAGGNASGEMQSGIVNEQIPDAVREEALKGVRLSHQHNYPSYNGIGLARGIQLATQDKIYVESQKRMCDFFNRNKRYKELKGFGNDTNPSKSYLAWLNWGGSSGYEWSCN